jgi:hypothetical protein
MIREMDEGAFADMLATASPQVQRLAREARALLGESLPVVVEVVWPRQTIAGYGVGPRKMSEQYCYLALFAERINLGFYYGADLPDPAGLLEGTGQLLRHIKVSAPEQLATPAVHDLVAAAARYLPRLKG